MKPKKEKQRDAFEPEPMMHTFVGFLRLANFMCAATVLFGLVSATIITMDSEDHKHTLASLSKANYTGFLQVILLYGKVYLG